MHQTAFVKFTLRYSNSVLKLTTILTQAIALSISFLSFIVFSGNALATEVSNDADKQWYQIEYIIFEHLQTDKHMLRYEDTPYPVIKDKQYTYLTNNPAPSSPYQYTRLERGQGILDNALSRLKRSRSVSVLDQGAWQQHLTENTHIPPININKSVSNERQLFGELELKKSRYTHAAFKLFLTQSFIVPFQNITDWFLETHTQWHVLDLITPYIETPSHAAKLIGTTKIYTNTHFINESRRIKNGEIHYIDHPLLSAIVTIKEIPSPEDTNNGELFAAE